MRGHLNTAPAGLWTQLAAVAACMRTRTQACPERQTQCRKSASGIWAKTKFSSGNYILSVSGAFSFFQRVLFQMQKYSLLYDCRNVHSIRIPGFLKGVAMHDPKEVDHLKLQLSLQREGFFGFWQYREASLWERFGARKVFTSSFLWLFQVTFNSQTETQQIPTISERSFAMAAAPTDKLSP